MTPYPPRYVSREKAAQERAQLRARLLWLAGGVVFVLMLMAFGYSDQAPAALRDITVALDRMLGQPILSLIAALAGR